MGPDEAEHVFERFYRSDPSRSRTHGGAGLGLSIVSAIVAAHGGTVHATGTAGTGTTFVVRLPVTPPDGDLTPDAHTDTSPNEQVSGTDEHFHQTHSSLLANPESHQPVSRS
jgi:two-component system OmpR family sensor kinase